jgi:hypothetical protein
MPPDEEVKVMRAHHSARQPSADRATLYVNERCRASGVSLLRPAWAEKAISGFYSTANQRVPGARVGALRVSRALVDVAMSDGDRELVAVAVAGGEMLCDRDRAVVAAGASDGDHKMGLALGHVLWQQEVEQ